LSVSRLQIVARGVTNRCPNCGGRTLFQSGTLFRVNPQCPRCGLKLEQGEGFFLGSLSLNYGVTLVGYLTPLLILAYKGVLSDDVATWLAIGGSLAVPVLLYRSSRSWWLMNYYLFLPQQLPANRVGGDEGGDDFV
jgi:uncharacterized protein (DUF983 family)